MGWISLIGAIIFEVFVASMMKIFNGFSRLIPTSLMFIGYIISFTLLTFFLKTVEVSVAYAIWSALGIVLISIIGIVALKKYFSHQKCISIILILASVVSLKLCTN